MEYKILPAILEKEWSEIEKKLSIVKRFTNTAHIDIIDGKFTNNTSFLDPSPFKSYSEDLFLELHMMVDNPIEYIDSFAKMGFRRFVGHIERMPNQLEFVQEAKKFGQASLAIDGQTDISQLSIPISEIDSLLIMTIDAGFSGQEFNERFLDKVRTLRAEYPRLPIAVDGGINNRTLVKALKSGANYFCVNSYLFSEEDVQTQFINLQSLL